ncbi:28S ribosomal protein S7-like protein [Dinothrombium tinctorium]|uniref:28S ribosomal protein S7-like protein n=1 Tax=Dinothrombium tinctorium TaxID=1965070 RepID=A0A443QZW4_9ACAR|nr:28S ribosomal protein S7-like protein [Dinothrombium tinctorium]
MSSLTRRVFDLRKAANFSNVNCIQKRNTVWPSNYIKPLATEQLTEVKQQSPEEFEKLKFVPVIAAPNHVSSSLFYNRTFDQFLKVIMRDGDKWKAIDGMRMALFEVKRIQLKKYRQAKSDEERAAIELNPLTVFEKAIENCKPLMITQKIKRGGATYQVPFPIVEKDSTFLAMKWLSDLILFRPKPRSEVFHIAMAKEIVNAYNNEGKVVKKKIDLHKLCEANKAYAHYRWS